MKLKNNFLITKPWLKMIFHQAHGQQPKLEIRSRIVWMLYGDIYMLSYLFSPRLLCVFWLLYTAMLEKKEYFLWLEIYSWFSITLTADGSLNSIMIIKMFVPGSLTVCHKWKPLPSLLEAGKQLKPAMIYIRAKINRLIKNLMDKLGRK